MAERADKQQRRATKLSPRSFSLSLSQSSFRPLTDGAPTHRDKKEPLFAPNPQKEKCLVLQQRFLSQTSARAARDLA